MKVIQVARHGWVMYKGEDIVGCIAQDGDDFFAHLAHGELVGTYASRELAEEGLYQRLMTDGEC